MNTIKAFYVPRFIILVAIATILSWTLGNEKFKFEHKALIGFENGFPDALDNWKRSGDWSNLEFTEEQIIANPVTDNKSYARYKIDIPEDFINKQLKLKISGNIEVDLDDASDEYKGDAGSLMTWLIDSNNEIFDYINIQEFKFKSNEYVASKTINLPENTTAFEVVLNSGNSKRKIRLTHATAELLDITTNYNVAVSLLAFLWGLICFLCIRWLHKYGSTRIAALVAALLTATLVGVLLPETFMSTNVDSRIIQLLNIPNHLEGKVLGNIYKAGHLIFFFLIALIVIFHSQKLYLQRITVFTLMILLAIATEGMQLHLLGRTTRLFDLAIDITGITLAALIATALTKLLTSSKQ